MRISDWSSDVCSSDLASPEILRSTREVGPGASVWSVSEPIALVPPVAGGRSPSTSTGERCHFRREVGLLFLDALAKLQANERRQLHRYADRLGRRLDDRTGLRLAVDHRGLLEQHDLLVELA